MNLSFDINSDELVVFTNKLERIGRSTMPKVVKNTINSVAFDVKSNTMPKFAKRHFEQRDKNFFKANSRVTPARGSSLESLSATVGFVANNRTKSNQAVEDLAIQERGGKISGRAFIPMKTARTSKSNSRMVARRNRTTHISNVINTKKVQGANERQRVLKASIRAGQGGYVLHGDTLFRVRKIGRKGSNSFVKLDPLYNYKKDREIRVRGTRFFDRSIRVSGLKINDIFVKKATTEINRVL